MLPISATLCEYPSHQKLVSIEGSIASSNTFLYSGGMGLTGGLVDAGNLFDCLYGIATGQADDSILDKYSEIRIKKYRDIINPISSDNIRRLWDASPDAIQQDPFFQAVERAKTDKEFEQQMKQVSIMSSNSSQQDLRA